MSLQIWLPLNKDIRNQGLSDATFIHEYPSYLTLNTASTKMGGSFKNTSAAYGALRSNKTVYLGKNQSMFCWVKVDQFNTDASKLTAIMGQHKYTACTGMGITMLTLTSTTGKLSVNTGDGNNGRTYNSYTGKTTLNAGTWYHVGFTYDNTTIKLYVNGQLDGSFTVPNLAVPEDGVHVFAWSLDRSSISNNTFAGYHLIGEIADARMYDHTLSTKEIKELAKGLIACYDFKDQYSLITGNPDNYFHYPTPGASAASAGWDAVLHKNAINVSNWSVGYNPGVKPTPELGYHAYWELIDNIPTMVFPKLNSKTGTGATRWLGISTTPTLIFNQGDRYVLSFEAMADSPGRKIHCGYYYNNGTASNFHDGYMNAVDIPVGKWKKYIFVGTVTTERVSGGAFYFYGMDGEDGIAYLRNPQLSTWVGDVLDYVIADDDIFLNNTRVLFDSSGFNNNCKLIGNGWTSSWSTNASSSITDNINNRDGISIHSSPSYNTYAQSDLIAIPESYTLIWTNLSGLEAGHLLDWRNDGAGVQPFYFNGSQIQYYSSAGGSAYFNYNFADHGYYEKCNIAIQVTPTTATLYIDGVKQQTISATNPAGTRAKLTIFGRYNGAAEYFPAASVSGALKIYSTALSDDDIRKELQGIAIIDNKHNLYEENIIEG